MGTWEEIWKGDGAKRLWATPDRRVSELAARWKESGAIRRVLDLGCGVGRHVYLFASQGFEVYGIDHSETGLETCRRRLHAEGLTADLRLGDMGTIPFPDGFFDAVVAFNSIYHGLAVEVDAGVELVRRKLRAGGLCCATFLSRDNRLYGKGDPLEPHTFADPRMYRELFGGDGESGVTHHFSSAEEVRHFFRAYEIESLDHEELRLALPGRDGAAPTWLPIRRSYFWHIVARTVDNRA
jgi:SAM-dependent methyltransferase